MPDLAGVNRDVGVRCSPVLVTKRIPKTIILPAFSATCGKFGCLQLDGNFGNGVTSQNDGSDYVTAGMTMEAWFYPFQNGGLKYMAREVAGKITMDLSVVNTELLVRLKDSGGGSHTFSTGLLNVIPIFQWTHVAITRFNDGDTLIYVYINGVVRFASSTAVLAVDDSSSTSDLTIGGTLQDGTLFSGYVGEFRVWRVAQTAENIGLLYNRTIGSDIYSDLGCYLKCNEGSGNTLIQRGQGTGEDVVINNANFQFLLDDPKPPVYFGFSFVAAQLVVVNTQKCSIRYPLTKPDDVNFGLDISWFDEDGVYQIRRLWTVEGIDAPSYSQYAGEVLPLTFNFECWNIDGENTIDLTEDFIVYLSLTTQPNNASDHTSVEESTPSINVALSEPYPWTTQDLDFDAQQTYV